MVLVCEWTLCRRKLNFIEIGQTINIDQNSPRLACKQLLQARSSATRTHFAFRLRHDSHALAGRFSSDASTPDCSLRFSVDELGPLPLEMDGLGLNDGVDWLERFPPEAYGI